MQETEASLAALSMLNPLAESSEGAATSRPGKLPRGKARNAEIDQRAAADAADRRSERESRRSSCGEADE